MLPSIAEEDIPEEDIYEEKIGDSNSQSTEKHSDIEGQQISANESEQDEKNQTEGIEVRAEEKADKVAKKEEHSSIQVFLRLRPIKTASQVAVSNGENATVAISRPTLDGWVSDLFPDHMYRSGFVWSVYRLDWKQNSFTYRCECHACTFLHAIPSQFFMQ